MQRSEHIELDKVELIVDAIFEGNPKVYESYSKYDCDIRLFTCPTDLNQYFESERDLDRSFVDLVIHYPEMNGFVQKEKINLNPDKCSGARLRYRINGWGLIHIQLDFKELEKPEIRIAVNSEKRAIGWSSTYPELKSPNLWNWIMVEKYARRLIRVLRKCA